MKFFYFCLFKFISEPHLCPASNSYFNNSSLTTFFILLHIAYFSFRMMFSQLPVIFLLFCCCSPRHYTVKSPGTGSWWGLCPQKGSHGGILSVHLYCFIRRLTIFHLVTMQHTLQKAVAPKGNIKKIHLVTCF